MTRHTLKLLRAEERSSGKPARDVTDRLREYRQLTEALAEYEGSRGGVTEARQFFETLGERMETLRTASVPELREHGSRCETGNRCAGVTVSLRSGAGVDHRNGLVGGRVGPPIAVDTVCLPVECWSSV